jgi:zinc transport system permease protein
MLSYQFMQNAVIAGILGSILCGIVGTFVVTKKLVFISGGISHIAFGGLGLAYLVGIHLNIGAIGFAVLTAIILHKVQKTRSISSDSMIGILWAAGMALGVVFMYLRQGYPPNLMSYLFGNILTVTHTDLYILAGFTFITVVLVATLFKEFVAISFDSEFARIRSLPVDLLEFVLMILIAISIVMLIQIVGVLLVIAMLVIPPTIARSVSNKFAPIIFLSSLIGFLMIIIGMIAAYFLDVPTGPTIVLSGVVLLLIVKVVGEK